MEKILTFSICNSSYKDSRIVIFGAPFDGTACYRPGSRFAPHAIRTEAAGLEPYSPYLKKEISEVPIFDAGDLETPFGSAARSLDMIEEISTKIISDGKIPFMIGGEHLVTLGAVRAAVKKYPDLNIIHFDAHADLADDYMGEKFSHATVIKRCFEIMESGKVFQFGIRSMSKEEDLFISDRVVSDRIEQNRYELKNLPQALMQLENKPVYLTIDIDVLDPSVLPGTGTPEPGGVSFVDLIGAIHKMTGLNIVGCDINELAPHYDSSGVSTVVACKVMRELLLSLKI